jgi:ferric-dicitrate binding protein FerR (iron transport regulator)
MIDTEHGDAVWKQALEWIMREHEELLDDAARNALRDWLAETPVHRQAYDQARTLWLVTGLVPTADEQNDPPPGDD